MLLFRSEEHVNAWSESRGLQRGETITVEQQWRLAAAWYADRADPTWRRRAPEEAEALFAEVGLTGPFWRLTS